MIVRRFVILFSILFLLVGCGSKREALPPPPIKVGVVTADEGELKQTLEMSGNLRFIANTTVSSEVSAQIQTIDVRDGQPVKQGQTLLTFDDSIIRAAADQASGNLQKDQATLVYNKAEWEKNEPLFKTGAISQSTYDQKLSAYQNSMGQVEADKGALAKAKEDLKHTIVTAPITGVLSNRFVEKGDWISMGGKLFQISDYKTIYVQTFLSDKDVAKLNITKVIHEGRGVEADVKVDSFPDKTFKGNIGYIQPVTNLNRLFEARIYIDNEDMQLFEGMYARAEVVVKTIPDVVRIPIESLLEQVHANEMNAVVLVNNREKAEITRIKIGETDRHYAAVLDGLNPGDRVVVEGKEVVNSGQPLEVAKTSTNRSQARADSEAPSKE